MWRSLQSELAVSKHPPAEQLARVRGCSRPRPRTCTCPPTACSGLRVCFLGNDFILRLPEQGHEEQDTATALLRASGVHPTHVAQAATRPSEPPSALLGPACIPARFAVAWPHHVLPRQPWASAAHPGAPTSVPHASGPPPRPTSAASHCSESKSGPCRSEPLPIRVLGHPPNGTDAFGFLELKSQLLEPKSQFLCIWSQKLMNIVNPVT